MPCQDLQRVRPCVSVDLNGDHGIVVLEEANTCNWQTLRCINGGNPIARQDRNNRGSLDQWLWNVRPVGLAAQPLETGVRDR